MVLFTHAVVPPNRNVGANRIVTDADSGTDGGRPCYFPFVYQDVEYFMCIALDTPAEGRTWCGTTYDYDTTVLYGLCPGLYCTLCLFFLSLMLRRDKHVFPACGSVDYISQRHDFTHIFTKFGKWRLSFVFSHSCLLLLFYEVVDVTTTPIPTVPTTPAGIYAENRSQYFSFTTTNLCLGIKTLTGWWLSVGVWSTPGQADRTWWHWNKWFRRDTFCRRDHKTQADMLSKTTVLIRLMSIFFHFCRFCLPLFSFWFLRFIRCSLLLPVTPKLVHQIISQNFRLASFIFLSPLTFFLAAEPFLFCV